MASNVAHGLSVWLSCSKESAIHKNLSSIVLSNAAPNCSFEPHITLAYMPKLNEKDIEQAVEKTRSLAKQFKPFGAEISNFQTGDAFFKSVFLEVKNASPLSELYSRAVETFSSEGAEYKPHISLFYGTNTKEIVSKIENSVKEHNLVHSTFPVDRLDLYLSEGTVDQWVHLGSSPLGDDLFFRSALFINNRWENPTKKTYLPVVNPATKQIFHYFPNGTSEDINKAVESSKKAFAQWSQTKGSERAKYLRAIADKIKEKLPSLAKTEVLDNGKPLMAASGDMNDVAGCFEYYATQAEELDKRQNQEIKLPDANYACQLRFDPVGVAGMIVPWNYPLLMAAWKVAPCLAAGCVGVLKPSELTPLTALELGAIVKEVGLPPGVLNIITGLGPDAGQPLSDHPDVDKIAFTGSVPTGSKVMSSASKDIKKVSLELGGKSPFIIFSDSNLDQAIEWIMFGIFANQGQVCSATSRVIVEESIYEKVLQRLVEESKKIKIGFGLEPENILGPVVSEGQYQKILDYIKKGQEQGAQVAYGGIPKEEQLLKGYFVPPTIFTNVNEKMKIWQEEIFGPVVCMKSFKTEQEALELANNSTYGLAAAVMSKDKERCNRVANALQAGIVWINCSQPTFMEAPWGGMKKSGTGRELGPWGLENYLETKQITSYQDENGLGYEWYIKKK